MAAKRILLVDDDEVVRVTLRPFLASRGWEVVEGTRARGLPELFASARPDLAILDYSLPDGDAVSFLPRLQEIDTEVPIVILTGHGSIDLAVRAIKCGAEQFLTKPVELEALGVIVDRLLEQRRHRTTAALSSRRAGKLLEPFTGTSSEIRRLEDQARTVAGSNLPLLVYGETGVGKGVLARWLHRQSPRAEEAFVDINCAGLSAEFLESELFGHERGSFTGASEAKKGLFELAHRGTVFLDEIGDMSLPIQAKLLKVLEEHRFRSLGGLRDRIVDIRLIAATHRDLQKLAQEGKFREDLLYRISTVPLHVPSLRRRRADIPGVAAKLLREIAAKAGRPSLELSDAAVQVLKAHRWPGNIRELKNVLERAVLFTQEGAVEPEALALLSHAPEPGLDTGWTLQELEARYIAKVLEEEQGRVAPAARRLGIHRSTLYEKIRRHGLAGGERHGESGPG